MSEWERLLKEHAEFQEENRRLRNENAELRRKLEEALDSIKIEEIN